MSEHSQTRQVPALSMRAAFTPKSVDLEARTVEVVFTTGARVLRGYYDRFWEELSLDPKHVRMERLNNGAPFLTDHDGYRVAETPGVVVPGSAKLESKRGTALIRFAKAEDDPKADMLLRKIADGIIQNVSIGYRVFKFEKVEDGADKIPVMRAVDWEPHEISAVAMGADDGAGFRSSGTEQNTCEFITRGVAPHKESSMSDVTQEKTAPVQNDAARSAEIKAEGERAAKAERERAAGITLAVRAAKLPAAFGEKLVSDGVELGAARALVLEELARASESTPTDNHVRIEAGEDARDKFGRGFEAAILTRGAALEVTRQASEKGVRGFKGADLDAGAFRALTLSGLCREYLETVGVRTRGMDQLKIIERAFTYRSGGMATAGDFPVLFENTMNKVLLGAYSIQGDTWSRICKVDEVSDFRPSNRYRTGSLTVLDPLNEAGEFKNKSIPDGQKTSITVGTKGNILALSRQMMINDDLGSFLDLAVKLGRAAKLTIEVDFYALLAQNSGLGPTMSDSNPFFHASRGNIGTPAAISVASLDADRTLMRKQKDISSNEYLDIEPRILLTPVEIGSTARQLNQAQYDPTSTKNANVPNIVSGMFRDIVDSPRVVNATRRYSFAEPGSIAAFVVAFLNGQQTPVLDSQDGFRVDGTEYKVRHDFLVQPFDPKGALTNAGV